MNCFVIYTNGIQSAVEHFRPLDNADQLRALARVKKFVESSRHNGYRCNVEIYDMCSVAIQVNI